MMALVKMIARRIIVAAAADVRFAACLMCNTFCSQGGNYNVTKEGAAVSDSFATEGPSDFLCNKM